MLLETCKPLQQDGQLRAPRAAARGEAAVAHAGQEPGLQRPRVTGAPGWKLVAVTPVTMPLS